MSGLGHIPPILMRYGNFRLGSIFPVRRRWGMTAIAQTRPSSLDSGGSLISKNVLRLGVPAAARPPVQRVGGIAPNSARPADTSFWMRLNASRGNPSPGTTRTSARLRQHDDHRRRPCLFVAAGALSLLSVRPGANPDGASRVDRAGPEPKRQAEPVERRHPSKGGGPGDEKPAPDIRDPNVAPPPAGPTGDAAAPQPK